MKWVVFGVLAFICLGFSRTAPYYIGADISWLPEKEAAGVVYSDSLGKRDLILILKDHGFNAIRLRVFNQPTAVGGYSSKGFCDVSHTLAMAKRVKALGMSLMIDFHYSDTWADPAHQITPLAWRNLSFPDLRDSVSAFSSDVMAKLAAQNTLPDMVQIGNEINPGFMLPLGSIDHFDQLGSLFKAGAAAVKAKAPQCKVILHLAAGNDNALVKWYITQLEKQNAVFDIVGLSCYTEWHGQPSGWKTNFDSLITQFPKYHYMIAEYSQEKEMAVSIPFQLPDERGMGAFIWEPTDYQEKIFNNGKANALLQIYPKLAQQFKVVSIQSHHHGILKGRSRIQSNTQGQSVLHLGDKSFLINGYRTLFSDR